MEAKNDNSRLYLEVPYSDKNEAKSLGAQWDSNIKKWYIPSRLANNPSLNVKKLLKTWGSNQKEEKNSCKKSLSRQQQLEIFFNEEEEFSTKYQKTHQFKMRVRCFMETTESISKERDVQVLQKIGKDAAGLIYCLLLENHHLKNKNAELYQKWLQQAEWSWKE